MGLPGKNVSCIYYPYSCMNKRSMIIAMIRWLFVHLQGQKGEHGDPGEPGSDGIPGRRGPPGKEVSCKLVPVAMFSIKSVHFPVYVIE